MDGPSVEFVAPCPQGHGGATWWTVLEHVPGAPGWDHLGESRPGHRVLCARCEADEEGVGPRSVSDAGAPGA